MMYVTLHFSCGGCDAKEDVRALVRKHFVSVSGRTYGNYRTELFPAEPYEAAPTDFEAIAPRGWVTFDPYTQCTYCPECWTSIETPAAVHGDSDAEA